MVVVILTYNFLIIFVRWAKHISHRSLFLVLWVFSFSSHQTILHCPRCPRCGLVRLPPLKWRTHHTVGFVGPEGPWQSAIKRWDSLILYGSVDEFVPKPQFLLLSSFGVKTDWLMHTWVWVHKHWMLYLDRGGWCWDAKKPWLHWLRRLFCGAIERLVVPGGNVCLSKWFQFLILWRPFNITFLWFSYERWCLWNMDGNKFCVAGIHQCLLTP